ncbi:MAG: ATP-dependent helicase, partial [Candidatus Diapherotrites archaeon]
KYGALAIYNYFFEQFKYLEIPNNSKLIIERFREGDKTSLVFHSLFGRRANDALSAAYGFAISKLMHKDVEISVNDNGFMLSAIGKVPLDKALSAVNSRDFRKILEMAIDNTEVLSRRFRHCAIRSLMILRSYKGDTKSAGRQQMASRLLLSAVRRIDNNFVVLREARREVLEDAMDISNAKKVVEAIEKKVLKVKVFDVSFPSPFGWNIAMQGRMDVMKMEDRLAFIKRMHEMIMEKIKSKSEVEHDSL